MTKYISSFDALQILGNASTNSILANYPEVVAHLKEQIESLSREGMLKPRYNGWTNYETWRVNLEYFSDTSIIGEHLSDGGVEYVAETWIRNESIGANYNTFAEDIAHYLTDYLQNLCEEWVCGDGAERDAAVDYAEAFLSDVNWYEIAKHIVEEYWEECLEAFELELDSWGLEEAEAEQMRQYARESSDEHGLRNKARGGTRI